MKFLTILVSLFFINNGQAQGWCDQFLTKSKKASQKAITDFMQTKFDVAESQITKLKQLDVKRKSSIGSKAFIYSLAAITSPLWVPLYAYSVYEESKYDCVLKCRNTGNLFIANFLISYFDQNGSQCQLKIKYKARGSFFKPLLVKDKVVKTIVTSYETPVCE